MLTSPIKISFIIILFVFPSWAMENNQFVLNLLSNRDEKACLFCLEEYAPDTKIGLFPCSHFSCFECTAGLSKCPICRTEFKQSQIYQLSFDNLNDNFFLHWKIQSSSEKELLSLLIELSNRSDLPREVFLGIINYPDSQQKTPLHRAALKNWHQAVSSLRSLGAMGDDKYCVPMAQPRPHELEWEGFCNDGTWPPAFVVDYEPEWLRKPKPIWNYPYDSIKMFTSDEPFPGCGIGSAPNRKFYRVEMSGLGGTRSHEYYIDLDERGRAMDSRWINRNPLPEFVWKPKSQAISAEAIRDIYNLSL